MIAHYDYVYNKTGLIKYEEFDIYEEAFIYQYANSTILVSPTSYIRLAVF